MKNNDLLITRIIISKAINRSPDSVRVVSSQGSNGLFLIDNFLNMNLVVGFDKVPTLDEAKNSIKDCYIGGCEMDFDTECLKSI